MTSPASDGLLRRTGDPLRRGIALILTAGLLTALVLLLVLLLALVRVSRGNVTARVAALRAALAAESGLAYAAARLGDGPRRPDVPEIANRGDDWIPRDLSATPSPRASANPSYSHGEHWADDAAGVPGAYDRDLDDVLPANWTDLDGDGRFSAWTGRLRGGATAFSQRFALSAFPATGLVCVNSGEIADPLGDHDLDGSRLNNVDTDYKNNVPADAYRDPFYPGNTHLVNLLDNLGAVLNLSVQTIRPYHAPVPAMGDIDTSTLGTLVVQNRPPNGYASVDQIRSFLSEADFAKVAPFLSTVGEVVAVPVATDLSDENAFAEQFMRERLSAPERIEFHARIDFNAAPLEVLQASLRYLSASGADKSVALFEMSPINTPFIRLGASEADAVAAALAKRRPIHTWAQFLATLHAVGSPLFEDDAFTQGVDEALDPASVLLKEDLILAQAMPAGYVGDPLLWRQNSLEVERDMAVPQDPVAPRRLFKDLIIGPLNALPYDNVGDARDAFAPPPFEALYPHDIPSRATTEYTLASPPPPACEIASEGWANDVRGGHGAARLVRGTLHFGEGIVALSGQRQLEQPMASPTTPWRFPGALVRAEAKPIKTGVQTYPLFDRASYDATRLPGYPGTDSEMSSSELYPTAVGGLRLESRPADAAELSLADIAIPFNADRIGEAGTWYNASDWTDNLGDPLEGAGPGGRRAPAPDVPAALFHVGGRFTPWGFRMGQYAPGSLFQDAYALTWSDEWLDHLPFTVDGDGRVTNATISLWYPACRGTRIVDSQSLAYLRGSLSLAATGAGAPYFTITWGSDHTLSVTTAVDNATIIPWWTDDSALSRAGWHHLAVTFDGAGQIAVYSDGRHEADLQASAVSPLGGGATAAVPAPGPPPPGPGDTADWTLSLLPPFDDVRLFKRLLSPDEIAQETRDREPYVRRGTYVSPPLLFDTTRIPAGATVRGLSWDGFIPALTNGLLQFDVVCRDGDGNVLNPPDGPGRGITWLGSESPSAVFTVGGCRTATIELVIDAETPADLPLGAGGAGAAVLRDTPHVGEMILYFSTARRPRWAGYAAP